MASRLGGERCPFIWPFEGSEQERLKRLAVRETIDTTEVAAITLERIELTGNYGKFIQVGTNPIHARAEFPATLFHGRLEAIYWRCGERLLATLFLI